VSILNSEVSNVGAKSKTVGVLTDLPIAFHRIRTTELLMASFGNRFVLFLVLGFFCVYFPPIKVILYSESSPFLVPVLLITVPPPISSQDCRIDKSVTLSCGRLFDIQRVANK